MADAIVSQGFTFEVGNADSPLTYTEVSEVVTFSGLDGSATEIDVSHLGSTAKEYLMGLEDLGSFQLECNYLSGDAGQTAMRTAQGSNTIQDFKATLSDNTELTFQGFVTTAPISGGVDAKVDASFTIRISGGVTFT